MALRLSLARATARSSYFHCVAPARVSAVSFKPLAVRARSFTTAAPETDSNANNNETQEPQLIYESNYKNIVKGLKRISVGSSFGTIAAAPFLIMHGHEGVPMMGKVAVAGAAVFFSVSCTSLLNFFTKFYVINLRLVDARTIELETLSLLGNPKKTTLAVDDLRVWPNMPPGAFQSMSNPSKRFYVHPELATHEVFKSFIAYDEPQ